MRTTQVDWRQNEYEKEVTKPWAVIFVVLRFYINIQGKYLQADPEDYIPGKKSQHVPIRRHI